MEHVIFVAADDSFSFPREQIRFPMVLRAPRRFRADDPSSWPRVEGNLEYVNGELLYMPPCADYQQDVVAEITGLLWDWARRHAGFIVATNEAGMRLGDDIRGADVAVWRRDLAGPHRGTFRRHPPELAVEVAGKDEDETSLREKARWYLDHGVSNVWLVFPRTRVVIELKPDDAQKLKGRSKLAPVGLPGLKPTAESFFKQLED